MPGVNSIKLLTGNSHPELAQMVADRLGIQQTICVCKKFADQSIDVRIGSSVRDEDVFVLQTSNSPYVDPNDSLMELHDKKDKSRAPITAKLVANMITVAGADHVITMDLHASQIQGFFDIPVDNLTSEPSVARWIRQCVPNYRDAIIVSPDAGGAKRATSLADLLGVDFALINRNRKREANKRLRAAAAQAQGISRASSFSDLRSGLSTPMTGSFLAEQPSASSSVLPSTGAGAAHAGDTVSALRAEAAKEPSRSASPTATLGAVNAQLATLRGDASESTTPRPPAQLDSAFAPSPPRGGSSAPAVRGATPVPQPQDIVNGVRMSGAGDWIATDEDGRKVASGGSRAQSQNRAAAAAAGAASSGATKRQHEQEEEEEVETKMEILVGDVDGKVAILVDDMVDTGRTLALAAKTLKEAGAKAVYAHISHGILSGASIDLLRRLDMERLVVTNTIPNLEKSQRSDGKLEIMDVSAVIAESIRRTHNGESISLLFQEDSVLL